MRRVALPSPSTMRPPESSSRSIAAAACTSGLRVKAFAIAVPIRTREVACAIAPSGAKPLRLKNSIVNTPSKPAASARSASSTSPRADARGQDEADPHGPG